MLIYAPLSWTYRLVVLVGVGLFVATNYFVLGIGIGADGSRLKRVGRAARLELNHLLGGRFHLTLWVKVREDWADDVRALQQLGLE